MPRRFSGALLREKRKAAGLKTERLAMHVDRSASSVNQYERDAATPSARVLAAMADTLDCSVEDFFVQEVEEAPVDLMAALKASLAQARGTK